MSTRKVRLRFNHWLPKLTGYNIMLYPYVLFAESEGDVRARSGLLKHEAEHFRQVVETGWFCFYVSYLLYYLAGLIRYRKHYPAYLLIPYETEARMSEGANWNRDHENWGFINES